jgi:EF-P beta-lysylation protein EpmB
MITASTGSRQHGGASHAEALQPEALQPEALQPEAWQPEPWQSELAHALTDPKQLLQQLGLDPQQVPHLSGAMSGFPLRVPRGFVRRMRRGDPDDPLLRQVLPAAAELIEQPGFASDPLSELRYQQVPGLLHKYRGRALLISTGACAVHCRYCFRREFPYGEAAAEGGRWNAALAAIAADPTIEEVILSGGDPLTLRTARLEQLGHGLAAITHVRRLRLHTRTPIVLPERVDDALLRWLAGLRWPCVIVLHANHGNEIDDGVRAAARQLRAAGATLLNQSVLLAGVNDSPCALEGLSLALWSAGVLPYYLNLLDRVRGSAHFEVPEARARALMAELAGRLPGYLVPRLVRDLPGAASKTVLGA